MVKIFQLIELRKILISLLILLVSACSGGGDIPSENETGGNSDYEDYVITIDGNINNPKTEALSAEYNTFLMNTQLNRNLFLGGKLLTGSNPDQCKVSVNCPAFLYAVEDYINDFNINGTTFYYVPLTVTAFSSSGDYTMTAQLLEGSTLKATQSFAIKIENYSNQGNWGLRVYQQLNYNKLDDTKDEIISSFKSMGVEFGSEGENIENIKSDLDDEIINYDYNPVPIEDDPCVQYAFSKIYPDKTTSEAIDLFFQQHPNEGLLFFVKDYNMLHPPAEPPIVLGYTSGVSANGINKRAPISFIFVDRHVIDYTWLGKYLQTTVIHELGHLWCENLTDSPTHSLWHNSDFSDRCVMKSNLTIQNEIPDESAKKVLNYRNFCTGHFQRGLNISWNLKQYSPFGEDTNPEEKILLASNTKRVNLLNGGLKIELDYDKTDIIQGESVDIFAKIKNNTTDTLIIELKHYIKNLDSDSTFSNRSNKYVHLPPFGNYYFMLDPIDYIVFGGIDFSSWTLKPGHYEYYLSCIVDREEYFSNKISINVNSVPDSLKQLFNGLVHDSNKNYSAAYSLELAERYNGTLYEQQFYFRLLKNNDYYYALQNKAEFSNYREQALELSKEFILKYPNTTFAYRLFYRIMLNYVANKTLVEEILTGLKNVHPNCMLLEALRNQPEYLNKQISHLLY